MSFNAPTGCNGYLQVDLNSQISNVPCTQLAWVKFSSGVSADKSIVSSGLQSDQCLRMNYTDTEAYYAKVEASNNITINSLDYDIEMDKWYLLAVVATSSNDHSIYLNELNGNSKTYSTTSTRGSWVLGEFVESLGVFSSDLQNVGGGSDIGEYIKVAEMAFYNKALSTSELNSLSTGVSPSTISNIVAHYRGKQEGTDGALTSEGLGDSTKVNPDLTQRDGSDGSTRAATTPPTYSSDHPQVNAPLVPAHIVFNVVIDSDNTPAPDATGVSYRLSKGTRSSNTTSVYEGANGVISSGKMTILTPGSVNGEQLVLSGDVTSNDIYDQNTKHLRGVGTVVAEEPGQTIWLTLDGTKDISVIDGGFNTSSKITYKTALTDNYTITNILSVVGGVFSAPAGITTILVDGYETSIAPTDGLFHEYTLMGVGTLTHVGSDGTTYFTGEVKEFSVDNLTYTLDKYTITHQLPDGGSVGENVILDPNFDDPSKWQINNTASVSGGEALLPISSDNVATLPDDDNLIPAGKVFQFDWVVTALSYPSATDWENIQLFSRGGDDGWENYNATGVARDTGEYTNTLLTTGWGIRVFVNGDNSAQVDGAVTLLTAKEWLNALVFNGVVVSDYDQEYVPPPIPTGVTFPRIAGMNIGAHDMSEWKMEIFAKQDLCILGMYRGWSNAAYDNTQAAAADLKSRSPNMLIGKYNMTMQIPLDGTDNSKQDMIDKCKSEVDWYVLDEPSGAHVIGQNSSRELVNITRHTTTDSDGNQWPEYFMNRCNTEFFDFTPNNFDIQYLDNFFTKPRVDNADWDIDGTNDHRDEPGVAEDYRDAYVDMVNQGRINQPNMLIMGTTADGTGSSCAFDNDEFNGVLDGGFLEHAINDPNGITEGTTYWNGWDKAMDRYRCLLAKSKNADIPYTIFGCSSDNKTDTLHIDTMRFGLTSALLDDGFFSFGSYASPTWYDEYDVYLGKAIDEPPLVEWSTNPGLWMRRFEFGMSVVNPVKGQQQVWPYPNQVPIQFSIPSGYSRFNAADYTNQAPDHNNGQAGTMTLNEGDGVILVKI